MLRNFLAKKLFILPLILTAGCAHMIEQRVITQFAKSLESQDISMIHKRSSEELKTKALTNPDALKELKYLQIPTGEVEIVKVEEISDTEKEIVVEVGESKTPLKYILIKNEDKKWVVDNILFKKELKRLTSSKSLIEQMTFLLTVRETVDAWESDNRRNIVELCTPELKAELKELPPVYLSKIGKQIFGKKETKSSPPKGQLDDDIAIVQLRRKNGLLVISLKKEKEDWLVDDIALQSREEHLQVPSLKKNAVVVNNTQNFLKAYLAEDRKSLEKLTSPSFYRGSLKFADLTDYKLPQLENSDQNFEVVMRGVTADLIIYGDSEITKIRLKKDSDQSDNITKTDYTVEEVVLYELGNNKEEKKLSSMFTAKAIMKVFHESWVNQDLDMLKKTSTKDLTATVWAGMTSQILPSLQLPELPKDEPEVVNVSFKGSLIEVTVNHGIRTVSYILKEYAGEVHVDDILLPVDNRPQSFKETLAILKPVHEFAFGIQTNQLRMVRNHVTGNFDRTVWSQIRHIPSICKPIPFLLQAPVISIKSDGNDKIVKLGFEDSNEVKVTLQFDKQRYNIDTIEYHDSSQNQSELVNLKTKLNHLLASGDLKKEDRSQSPVVPAEFLIEDESFEQTKDSKVFTPEIISPKSNELSLPEPADDAFVTPQG